jgi:hypothetical protein
MPGSPDGKVNSDAEIQPAAAPAFTAISNPLENPAQDIKKGATEIRNSLILAGGGERI